MKNGVKRKDLEVGMTVYYEDPTYMSVYKIKLIESKCETQYRKDGNWLWFAEIKHDEGVSYNIAYENNITLSSGQYDKLKKKKDIESQIDKLQKELRNL